MFDKMKYINSKGQVIEFGELPYLINYSDIRKHSWDYETYQNYNRIARFNRGLSERQLPVVIVASNGEACTAAKNNLHEIIDYDVIKKQKGKLYIGDYYINGYFIAAEPSAYLESSAKANITLTFCSEKTVWYREVKNEFFHMVDSAEVPKKAGSKSPSYGYAYDYMQEDSSSMMITNEAISDAAVVIIINGQAENPSIRIGKNLYEFELTIDQGEYLVIDGLNKEAMLHDIAGNKISVFGYRNKEYDLFAKVPEGNSMVSWNGSFGFSVTLYEERSEPKWI